MKKRKFYDADYRLRHAAEIKADGAARREEYGKRPIEQFRAQQAAGGTKQCARCKAVKPLTEFAINRTMADGWDSLCKVCRNAVRKVYRDRKKGAAG